jgi:hypothetical protein
MTTRQPTAAVAAGQRIIPKHLRLTLCLFNLAKRRSCTVTSPLGMLAKSYRTETTMVEIPVACANQRLYGVLPAPSATKVGAVLAGLKRPSGVPIQMERTRAKHCVGLAKVPSAVTTSAQAAPNPSAVASLPVAADLALAGTTWQAALSV